MVTASNSPDACLSFKVSRHDETFATLKHPMIDIVASGNTALALATTFDVNQQRVNTCRRNVNVKRTSLAVGPSTWMRMRSISLLFSFPFFFPPPPPSVSLKPPPFRRWPSMVPMDCRRPRCQAPGTQPARPSASACLSAQGGRECSIHPRA